MLVGPSSISSNAYNAGSRLCDGCLRLFVVLTLPTHKHLEHQHVCAKPSEQQSITAWHCPSCGQACMPCRAGHGAGCGSNAHTAATHASLQVAIELEHKDDASLTTTKTRGARRAPLCSLTGRAPAEAPQQIEAGCCAACAWLVHTCAVAELDSAALTASTAPSQSPLRMAATSV